MKAAIILIERDRAMPCLLVDTEFILDGEDLVKESLKCLCRITEAGLPGDVELVNRSMKLLALLRERVNLVVEGSDSSPLGSHQGCPQCPLRRGNEIERL
jgi:hypothetical protein